MIKWLKKVLDLGGPSRIHVLKANHVVLVLDSLSLCLLVLLLLFYTCVFPT